MKKISFIFLLFLLVFLVSCGNEVVEVVVDDIPNGEVVEGVEATGVVHEVRIESLKFSPTDLEVELGDSVNWINEDNVAHTVTFENAMLDQHLENKGEVELFVNAVGELRYFCVYHPGMQGKVVVK
jgi:plastocyanin